MKQILPTLIAALILMTFGLAEGIWTNRWTRSFAIDEAAARFATVPANVGEWESRSEEMDPRQVVKAELSGWMIRHYKHRTKGTTLTVVLVCGRAGPISLHTPDVCFVGSGYTLLSPPTPHTLAFDRPAIFNVARFRVGVDGLADYRRTYWGWSADGDWSAPTSPRIAFARAPALYKLYVVRPMNRGDEPLTEDPAQEFLRLFLEQLREYLFAPKDSDSKQAS